MSALGRKNLRFTEEKGQPAVRLQFSCEYISPLNLLECRINCELSEDPGRVLRYARLLTSGYRSVRPLAGSD